MFFAATHNPTCPPPARPPAPMMIMLVCYSEPYIDPLTWYWYPPSTHRPPLIHPRSLCIFVHHHAFNPHLIPLHSIPSHPPPPTPSTNTPFHLHPPSTYSPIPTQPTHPPTLQSPLYPHPLLWLLKCHLFYPSGTRNCMRLLCSSLKLR